MALIGATLLVAAPASASAATVFVDDDDPGGSGCGSLENPCNTIQEGIDVADPGDVVQVRAGTYVEQLDIDKGITLRGVGVDTHIKSPDESLLDDKFDGGSPDDRRPVVFVHDLTGAGATIENLKVNGFAEGGPSCDFIFYGVAYVKASGTVRNVSVTHVRNNPLSAGCTGSSAIYNSNQDGEDRSWTVEDSVVTDYQKAGIVANETGLEATVTGNTVIGAGPQPDTEAQNGIQVGFGALGTVSANTVTGNACDFSSCGPDPTTQVQAGGILLVDAGAGTQVTGNEAHGNDAGLLDSSATGSRIASGNDLSSNRYVGIYTDDGSLAVSENNLAGAEIGLAAVSFAGDFQPNVTATGNTIADNVTGVALLRDAPTTDAPTLSAAFNRIAGNSGAGLDNETDATVNAENNWWGCNAGPTDPACDSIGGSGALSVDADPFLVMKLIKGTKSNGKRTITANLRFNSDGTKFVPTEFPDGTEVAFTATRGTIPSVGTTIDGKAVVIHRKPGSTHKATITATLDAETLEIRAR